MTTTNKLILISEDRVSVKAECLNCNKVLQIEKKNLHSLGDQFKFRNSITCLCGNVYFDITLDKKPLTNISETSSKKLNTKEFPETKNKGCLYIIIFAVFILGLILISRDDSSKKITHNPEEAKRLLEINAIKKAEENATTDFSIRTKTHEEKINDARLEGIKALQELDTSIRDDIQVEETHSKKRL